MSVEWGWGSLLMAWTLGWGFSTLKHLKSNFNNSVCKDSGATDVLGDLSAWTQLHPHPTLCGHTLTRLVVAGVRSLYRGNELRL